MNRALHFLAPGDLATRTGGFIYDRRMIDALRGMDWQVVVHDLGSGFPDASGAVLQRAGRLIARLPDDTLVVADGLAFGVLADAVAAHAQRLRWVALVHHPLAMESGLDAARRQVLFDSEREALAHARGVIVTSASTAAALADYGVARERITVVEPGTDPAPLATGSGGDAMALLCVATLTPRKGHTVLLEALAGLMDRQWTLHCVGSLAMDPACSAAVNQAVQSLGLQQRVVLHGELEGDALESLYAGADAFVLPSFHEGYGMALAEALAHGLPVISTRAGAIPDTVPPDAGALVPPGDVGALQAALQRLMDSAQWRADATAGALRARSRLRTWPEKGVQFADALERLAASPEGRA